MKLLPSQQKRLRQKPSKETSLLRNMNRNLRYKLRSAEERYVDSIKKHNDILLRIIETINEINEHHPVLDRNVEVDRRNFPTVHRVMQRLHPCWLMQNPEDPSIPPLATVDLHLLQLAVEHQKQYKTIRIRYKDRTVGMYISHEILDLAKDRGMIYRNIVENLLQMVHNEEWTNIKKEKKNESY